MTIGGIKFEEVSGNGGCGGCWFYGRRACLRPDTADNGKPLECDGDGREDGKDIVYCVAEGEKG